MNFSMILDEALQILGEKCVRRGDGIQYYWHVSAAWGFVKFKLGRESFNDMKLVAVDRIEKLYQRVLAFQEGPPKPSMIPHSAAVPRMANAPTSPSSWFYSTNVLGVRDNA